MTIERIPPPVGPPHPCRWFLNARRNSAIEQRNDARVAATQVLGDRAGLPRATAAAVDAKVAAARRLAEQDLAAAAAAPPAGLLDDGGRRMVIDQQGGEAAVSGVYRQARGGRSRLGPRVVGDEDIVYDSGKEAAAQDDGMAADEWERRLQGRQGRRDGGAGRSGWGQ